MDFSLSDEQKLLLENLDEFLNRYIDEEKVKKWYYEDHTVPDEVTKAFVDAGFGYLGIPEEHGGMPCDYVTLAMVYEAINRHCAISMPFMLNALTIFDVCEFGNAEQILGGLGYTTEMRVGRLWNDARGNRIGAGTDEIMVYIAERLLLKKYKR